MPKDYLASLSKFLSSPKLKHRDTTSLFHPSNHHDLIDAYREFLSLAARNKSKPTKKEIANVILISQYLKSPMQHREFLNLLRVLHNNEKPLTEEQNKIKPTEEDVPVAYGGG